MDKMKILILEDDAVEVKKLESCISARKELELVEITNSCKEAIYIMKNNLIEGVIVDIELNKGIGGSGLDFLKELKEIDLEIKPLTIVTTNNESDAVYKACKSLKVDMIYYKSKEDYSPTIILNQFLTLRPFIEKKDKKSAKSKIENEIERNKRIEEYILEEMNLIGLPPHLKGTKYIKDALLYLITNKNPDDNYYTNFLSTKYKVRKGGISTSMQDAINSAWRNTPEEDILENFKANISFSKGTPTPVQFLHYYAEKIKRRI